MDRAPEIPTDQLLVLQRRIRNLRRMIDEEVAGKADPRTVDRLERTLRAAEREVFGVAQRRAEVGD